MVRYKANYYYTPTITRIEVDRETSQSVFFGTCTERKQTTYYTERKKTTYHRYFNTFEAAVGFLREQFISKLLVAEDVVRRIKADLAAIEKMEDK